jgi:hypothetical protein
LSGIAILTDNRTQIMEPAGNLHHAVSKVRLGVPEAVFHDSAAFDSGNYMLGGDAEVGHHRIPDDIAGGAILPTRLFLRLTNDHPLRRKTLEAAILMEATAGGGR